MTMNVGPKLPLEKNYITTGNDGEIYVVDVSIKKTLDRVKYPPDGVKSVFRVFKINGNGERELVILIDNHEPIGFHEHDKLPGLHDSRKPICEDNWQKAWDVFDKRMKELFS